MGRSPTVRAVSANPRHRADQPTRPRRHPVRQIVQALLILCRLHRLADLGQRLYEFCQDRWPQNWFIQLGDRIADLVAWFDQFSGPPLP